MSILVVRPSLETYTTLDCRDGAHSACGACSCTCHEEA